MQPEVEMKGCDILETEERPYTSKSGTAATSRAVVFKYGGKIFKMSCERTFDMQKAKSKDGKKANITLAMSTFGQSIEPAFRIQDVV